MNVDVNSQEIIVDGLKQFENKEIGKIKLILNFFNVRAIISENLSVITKKNLQCTNCNKDIIESYKKNYFISFNVEKIKKLKKDGLDIMNAFESLDKNIISREYCEYCKKKANFKKTKSIYNTSQNLIILFDRGENCKHKDLINFDMVLNLDKKYIEIMRLHKETYSYILYGIIIRREKNDPSSKNKKTEEYNYYTRDLDENFFTRNDRRDTYNLTQVKSEGDVVGLFYHCKDLIIQPGDIDTKLGKNKDINTIQREKNIDTSNVLNPNNNKVILSKSNIVFNNVVNNSKNIINNSAKMNLLNNNMNNNMNLNNNNQNMNLNNNNPNMNLNNNMNLIYTNQNMNLNNNMNLQKTEFIGNPFNNEINLMNNLMLNNKFSNNINNNVHFNNMNNDQIINNQQPNNNIQNMNYQNHNNFMNNNFNFNNPNNNFSNNPNNADFNNFTFDYNGFNQ